MQKVNGYQKWLYYLISIVIILGIFFRFANLDKKVYWHDEVFTSLHIAGYPPQEWMPALFNGKILGIQDLHKYLEITPERGINSTVRALAVGDPHHPPFYYIVARFWVQWLGNSVTVIRSLSAAIALLALPAIYWLCLELFESSLIGWIAVAIVSVSPLYILYAQEAREYSLWTVIILLASAILLKAIKVTHLPNVSPQKIIGNWAVYSFTLIVGLYTSLFTAFAAIGQGIYVLIVEKIRLTKTVFAYGIAFGCSILAFSPWIIVFIRNYEQYKLLTDWAKTIKIPTREVLKVWGLNISRIFFDIGWDFDRSLIYLVILAVLLLVGYSLYFLCRTTSIKIWGFILSLIGVPIIFLLLPDLLFGGVRSLSPRYLISCFVGIQLAIAYLLADRLTNSNITRRKIWSLVTVTIFSAGIISCVVNLQSDTSWTKVISYSLPQVSRIIDRAESPLLVGNSTSYNPANILALSYLVKPEVKFQLLAEETGYRIPPGFSDVFFLSPSDSLREQLEREQNIKLEFLFGDNHLWLWKANLDRNL